MDSRNQNIVEFGILFMELSPYVDNIMYKNNHLYGMHCIILGYGLIFGTDWLSFLSHSSEYFLVAIETEVRTYEIP